MAQTSMSIKKKSKYTNKDKYESQEYKYTSEFEHKRWGMMLVNNPLKRTGYFLRET